MELDYYAPWEWQPIERMADGCCDVTIKFANGETREICSCDYWWSLQRNEPRPTEFRFN